MRKTSMPQAQRTFGFATYMRQTFAVARTSFVAIASSWSGLVLLAAIALLVVLLGPVPLHRLGVALLPTTARVISLLAAPVAANPGTPWAIIPLLVVFYAGKLVWRERDAGLNEIADTTPVPEWVLLLGKFLGLCLLLLTWVAILTAAGVLVQVRMGYFDFELGLYFRTLFGLQLVDYVLFALLVFVLHAVVNQKHIGYLAALLAYGVISFSSRLGIEHHLLVYGSDPGWSYTDMRSFGTSLGPWLWLKSYWAAWSLLLVVVARLLWVRGREPALRARFKLARRRLTRATAVIAAATVVLIATLGSFIFYETNVLNASRTATEARRADYERQYAKYAAIPQPQLTETSVHVEIYPRRQAADVRGTYTLENHDSVAIDLIHLTTSSEVETGAVTFDRPARVVTADDNVGYRIYALEKPLEPGESLRLDFEVHHSPVGFHNSRVDASVVADGTYFTNRDWFPAIGYKRNRELWDASARKRYGLAPRAALASLDDAGAREMRVDSVAFHAIVGTDEGQTAVAPGALRRTWTERGRRYFDYATNGPILNDYSFFSANYAMHEAPWNPGRSSGQTVAIRIYHHPRHSANLPRVVRGVHAALEQFTEQFGRYPYNHLTIVERGSHGDALNAQASLIDYGEGFSLFRPSDGPRGLDIVFFAIAHEVAHQWWGWRVRPASVEGEVLMAEGMANYLAMRLLEKTYGYEHLQRYLSDVLWVSYQVPRTRAAAPLLRADTAFLGYRKGAHALYALSRYIGQDRMDVALRRLFEKHSSGTPPLPTTLDLYRELQAVTPDSLQYLLHDLFEANTYWELEAKAATAHQTESGDWEVAIDVQARKVVVDEAGIETELPMDDRIQVGVFASDEQGGTSDEPRYVESHRLRSGEQTITVIVPDRPTRAGVDPNNLLIDLKANDNITSVTIKNSRGV